METEKSKITIIGAGIIGVAIAYRLTSAGHKVTLIDRDAPGMGASFGNAGHFATEQVFPLASPDVLGNIPQMMFDRRGPLVLKPAHMLRFLPWGLRFLWASRKSAFQRGIRATKSLNDGALAHWRELLSETGLSDLGRTRGSLEIFQTGSAFRQAAALAERFIRHGVRTEILNARQVRERVPALTGDLAGALFFPDTGHTVNPHRLVTAIFDQALAKGLCFIQDDITALDHKAGRGVVMRGGKGIYETEKLVLSSGVLSRDLLKSLGLSAPLEAERGYHYMLPRPGIAVDLPLTFHERKFILTPMEHGIRLAGTVEFAGVKAPPTPNRARMLFDFARQSFPELDDRAAEEWMGFRPTLPDYLPVIDRRDNIVFAFGHQHLGLTQAAITARLVQEMISGAAPAIDLSPFRLDRF